MASFNRAEFDFNIPEEVKTAIDNLEAAVLSDSSLVDCYLEEFRAVVHWNEVDIDGYLSEDEAEELIDYYYRRNYIW